jgi:hypothetical protein
MNMIRIVYRVNICLLIAFLAFSSCKKEKGSESETLISFEGGKITSADVEKRAGEHLTRLRKKQAEIINRVAMELLIEELGRREGNQVTKGEETKQTDKSEKNEELKKLFSKYNVKSFIKKSK